MVKLPSVEHVRHLYVMQRTAKSRSARTRARNELLKITKSLQGTANRRLYALRKSNYAYGTTYDTTAQYLEQRGIKNFALPTEARRGRINKNTGEKYPLTNETYDYTLRLLGFLHSKETTITGQKAIEKKRFGTYRERYTFASEMTDNDLRDFLRFLGNAGVDEYLDYYGEASGDEMEEIETIFEKANKEERKSLAGLFEDFNEFQKQTREVQDGKRADVDAGLPNFTTLRNELKKTYEDITKRERK